MSKNITIQEGGVGKQLTIDKIKTDLVGGGTCLWVPEDEIILGTKSISSNGNYSASADGLTGFSQVYVNVAVGTATGTDGDGDEAVAYTDPDTGELVVEKVPSSIEVITPPTNPYGIYKNGQTISTNGMVVKAYLETGEEYGIVPNGEITIFPTTAVYDGSTDYGEATSDVPNTFPQPIPYGSSIELHTNSREYSNYQVISGGLCTFVWEDTGRYNQYLYVIASEHPFTRTTTYYQKDRDPYTVESEVTKSYTYNGETVYYYAAALPGYGHSGPGQEIHTNSGDYNTSTTAWAIVYGEKTGLGSHQTINVSWPRPLDGKVLETTFEIRVAPPIYGDSEN